MTAECHDDFTLDGEKLSLADFIWLPRRHYRIEHVPRNYEFEEELEKLKRRFPMEFRKRLREAHGVYFNNLYVIANMPVNRFLDFLLKSGNYDGYMNKLVNAFNPSSAMGVMCRNTISVSWDGYIYDCDFNQMLDIKVEKRASQHVRNFDFDSLLNREIIVDQHCFGCTAGEGSSCQGALS